MISKENLIQLADDYQRRHPGGEVRFSMAVALEILTSTEILLNSHDNADLAALAEMLRARKIGEHAEFVPEVISEQTPPEEKPVTPSRIEPKEIRRRFFWWQNWD